jgi:enoyl-[acyl-carrier protein] reductase I
MASGFLEGKKGLIMGVANDMSIAWGIAQAVHAQGADLAFSYQGEPILKRITPLAESIGCGGKIFACDASNATSVASLFENVGKLFNGQLDFIVHAIAFANKKELTGRYLDTSKEGFTLAMEVSCFSFVEVMKHASVLMKNGGSALTLTYYGAEKVIPNYNVMGVAKAALEASVRYLANDLGKDGIRVNSISAGPIRTLAASGIGDFRSVLDFTAANAPMRKNVTQADVGNVASFLLSDLSNGVTGENIYVDSGYNIIGMPIESCSTER